MSTDYADYLALRASRVIKHKADEKANRPAAIREYRKAVAAGVYPNNIGGYPGKRGERKPVAPLSPSERFARLKAAYLAKSKPRRQHGPSGETPIRRWEYSVGEFAGRILAPTKSEARAEYKRKYGVRSTRGVVMVAA